MTRGMMGAMAKRSAAMSSPRQHAGADFVGLGHGTLDQAAPITSPRIYAVRSAQAPDRSGFHSACGSGHEHGRRLNQHRLAELSSHRDELRGVHHHVDADDVEHRSNRRGILAHCLGAGFVQIGRGDCL